MTLVTVIDGTALHRAVDRLSETESYASTGTVSDEVHESMSAAIRRGMDWLDEQFPGWLEQIDPESIDLSSSCDCLLGTLDHNFYEAMLRAGHAEVSDFGIITPDWEWARDHGFAATSSIHFEEWDVLTAMWRQRIAMRKVLARVDGEVQATVGDLVDA